MNKFLNFPPSFIMVFGVTKSLTVFKNLLNVFYFFIFISIQNASKNSWKSSEEDSLNACRA